ncbi:calcium/sodium antiporter [Desulfuromonas sp. AOP6]|uniref:calcium/sodium antiporter n=1 Tax=Desulfuromonas sp. AOP6 TaxID=1566351 RepID=UPI00127776FA|nr:calcium/sodium antiporter [Desulfuromonas sp. AOP6]BCA79047.1 sodium:calcium antiporter [Desulfuromonas sp. AOP6]
MTFLLLLAGLILLVLGAEGLVRGASHLAAGFGISPLIIGLTVVAFGTSSPELAVSIKAALSDQASIALGNVVGSNIFNVLFILGLSALAAPLVVSQQLVRLDVPLMILLSVLMLVFGYDNSFSRLDGGLLFAGLISYIFFLIRQSRRESAAVEQEYAGEFAAEDRDEPGWLKNSLLVVGGLALLVLGSRWLVESAVTIAQALGLSEEVIGLTIVAAGTSLPEVVTSLIATLRGKVDIAVGNIIGSNIFNIMGVLGLASLISPTGMEVSSALLRFDIPIMITVAVACLPIFFTGNRISRFEGAILLGYYAAYTLFLILATSQHAALPRFNAAMLYFILPLTALTLGIVALREIRARKGRHSP